VSPRRADSAVARLLAPLAGSLWTVFVIWSGFVAVIWTTGWGETHLAAHVRNPELRDALAWLLRALDAIWLTLGAVSVYFALVRAEGIEVARRWSAIALLVGLLIHGASARTDWPLGPVHYTSSLGMKLGPVPSALPVLWLFIVVGARDLAQVVLPRASHGATALLAGGIALLTDVNLEPLAWEWRVWWLWYPEGVAAPSRPPLQNYATWLLAGAALAYAMRSPRVLPRLRRRPFEPIAALAILNAVCLLTHAALFVRR